MVYDLHGVKNHAIESTLASYGLTKEALNASDLKEGVKRLFTWKEPGAYAPGIGGFAKGLGKEVLEYGREAVFGSPVNAARQFQAFKDQAGGSNLKALGHYIKNFYVPSRNNNGYQLGSGKDPSLWARINGPAMQGLRLLGPTLDLYNASQTEDPNVRRGDYASALTGIAIAPFTASLGMAGAVLHPFLQQQARKLVQKSPEEYVPHYDVKEHAKLLTRNLNSYDQPDLAYNQG